MHKDQVYISYLQENNNQGIQLIYNQYATTIITLIRHNSGSEDDGYDILQESLVDIYHMANTRNFVLTTSFSSFLSLVCKRKWLNVLKKKKQLQVTNNEESLLFIEDPAAKDLEDLMLRVDKENRVMEVLNMMGQRCQDIIRQCLIAKHQEQVAVSMGISYAYLRKKKSECMSVLVTKVKALGLF